MSYVNVRQDLHIRLKLNGSREKREFFHYCLGKMDMDYPHPPDCLLKLRAHRKPAPLCGTCGGGIWERSVFDEKQIRALSRQINDMAELPGHLKLRVKRWELASKCPSVKKPVPTPPFIHRPAPTDDDAYGFLAGYCG